MATFLELIDELGGFGKYQRIRAFALLFISLTVPIIGLTSVFALAEVNHECFIPTRNRSPYKEMAESDWRKLAYPIEDPICRMHNQSYYSSNQTEFDFERGTQKCESYIIKPKAVLKTATEDFGLVCDKAFFVETSQSVLFLGQAVGLSFAGQLADKMGRKCVLISSNLLATSVAALTAFIYNLYLYLFARFVSGCAYAVIYLVVYTIVCEMVSPKVVVFLGFLYEATFGFGFTVLAVIAYFVPEWRNIQIAVALLGVPAVLMSFWAPESLRWLVTVGKIDQAKDLANTVAQCNGIKGTKFEELIEDIHDRQMLAVETSEEKKQNSVLYIVDIFRTKRLNIRLCITAFCWFVISGLYYGLSVGAGTMMPGNLHMNVAISGVVTVPACVVAYPIAVKIGRKWLLALGLISSGVGCSFIVFTYDYSDTLTQILAQWGKLCSAVSFGIVYVYTLEMTPTCARFSGMAFCSIMARIGSVLCPYASILGDYWKPLGFLTYGVLALAAGSLALFLPETLGAPLQETLADAAHFNGRSKKDKNVNDVVEQKL